MSSLIRNESFIDLLDLRFFSKNNGSYLDITYLNLDDISKLKSNPTASAIFADLSTHNFKKGFSFDRLKAKSNSFCFNPLPYLTPTITAITKTIITNLLKFDSLIIFF